MEQDLEHISSEQLLAILDGDIPTGGDHPVAEHLRLCQACARLVAMSRKKDHTLRRLSEAGFAPPAADCLDASALAELATGIAAPERAPALLAHAARCDYCGAALRSALQDLQRQVQPEDEPFLQSLPSATSSWQQRLARRLAPAASRTTARPASRWVPIGLAASLVLAAVLGWQALPRYRASRIETLLAQAFTAQRPFDFRLPDQGHAPVARTRTAGSTFDRPSPLLTAHARLAQELPSRPDDPRWLYLRGLAELLDSDPDSAIESLEQARRLKPGDPEILTELAIAHALRGEIENHPIDFGTALDLLSRALRLQPDTPRILYNRALVHERLSLVHEAISDWRRYLVLDPSGAWSEDARLRLRDLEERLAGREARWRRLHGGPGAFLKGLHAHDPPLLDAWLDRAAPAWLASSPTPDSFQAAAELALRVSTRHRDQWFQHLLNEIPPGHAAHGEMLAVIDANIGGDANQVLKSLQRLLPRFAALGPATGLRARFEQVYALRRAILPAECRDQGAALLASLAGRPYPWLRSQTRVDYAVCAGMLGDEGHALRLLAQAEQEAAAHGLEAVALRARAMRVGTQTNAGDPWIVWNEGLPILERYWSSEIPHPIAHLIAFRLASSSEALGLAHAAPVFASAGVRIIASGTNRFGEALSRSLLASYARKAGQLDIAAAQTAQTRALLAALPASPATSRYLYATAIDEIDALLENHQPAKALTQLQDVRRQDPEPPTFLLALQSRRLAARAHLDLKKPGEAAAELEQGLELIRARLHSLRAPRERLRVLEDSAGLFHDLADLRIRLGDPDAALALLAELHDIQPAPNTLVVASLPSGLAAWRTHAAGPRFHFDAGATPTVRRQFEQLLALAASPASPLDSLHQLGRQLFARLLEPLYPGESLPPALEILASGDVRGMPFHLLRTPRGHYLAEESALSFPGAAARPADGPILLDAAAPALVAASPAAPPRFAVRSPFLPDAGAEARDVASHFPRHTLLIGASLDQPTLQRHAPATALFHFSGHGYSSSGNGGLLLPGDAALPLTSPQIAAMDWSRCRLAVLSACLTATGELQGYVNPDSLVRAFLAAGARGVLAASWAIDSRATHLFFENFYRHLLAGRPAAIALQHAATDLRRRTEFAHPYYWAPFQLYR